MSEPTELPKLVEALNRAIEGAEHKPGEWAGTVQSMGGICCPGEPFKIGQTLAQESTWAQFSYKRDSWLAVAAVNALPQLLSAAAQNEALRKQVAALQSDANSWQSGYDEGRRIGSKTNLSEIDRLRPAAALHEQVQRAAGELPEGWEIKICIELWAGTVDLFHNGNPTEFEADGETLADKVDDAIETAKQEAQ